MGTILNDLAHMRDAVLFDGATRRHKLSRFWILLLLASVIASAGVVGDSTATVIGAMIVAPMMLPIQGTMLSTVLGDRTNLIRSVFLVITGALAAIAIAFVVGLLDPNPVVAATNSQVDARVTPGLIDLLAALGTGIVGSIALVRKDISDTLPGVAIAISLVPPLCVVGLTLESGAFDEALGALLLFVTNVAAILGTGVVVMTIYRVRRMNERAAAPASRGVNQRGAVLVIAAMLVIVGIPLTFSTVSFTSDTTSESTVQGIARTWAGNEGWDLVSVITSGNDVVVRVTGTMPAPETDALKSQLAAAGIDTSRVHVQLVPSYNVDL